MTKFSKQQKKTSDELITEMPQPLTTEAMHDSTIHVTHIVCLRFMVGDISLATVPCAYMTNRGYEYDLTNESSIVDFVQNQCEIEVSFESKQYHGQVIVREIQVYPASESYLCTANEGEYELTRGSDGLVHIYRSKPDNGIDMFRISLLAVAGK